MGKKTQIKYAIIIVAKLGGLTLCKAFCPPHPRLTFTKAQMELSSPPVYWCGNSAVSILEAEFEQTDIWSIPNLEFLTITIHSIPDSELLSLKQQLAGKQEQALWERGNPAWKKGRDPRKLFNTALEKNKRKQRIRFYKKKSKTRISLEEKQNLEFEGSWETSFVLIKTWKPRKDV